MAYPTVAQRAVAVCLLLATAASGCGLFSTRDPENPITAGSQFEPPTSPSIVLRNLQSALNFANAQDYRRCFSDTARGLPSYHFVPSVQGSSVAPLTFMDWTINNEEEYIQSIFAQLVDGAVASVSFSPAEVTGVPIGDSVQFTADYVVNFPHTREGIEHEAEGSLQFTFSVSPQNEWYISYWRDFTRDNKPSWSLIKARFSD